MYCSTGASMTRSVDCRWPRSFLLQHLPYLSVANYAIKNAIRLEIRCRAYVSRAIQVLEVLQEQKRTGGRRQRGCRRRPLFRDSISSENTGIRLAVSAWTTMQLAFKAPSLCSGESRQDQRRYWKFKYSVSFEWDKWESVLECTGVSRYLTITKVINEKVITGGKKCIDEPYRTGYFVNHTKRCSCAPSSQIWWPAKLRGWKIAFLQTKHTSATLYVYRSSNSDPRAQNQNLSTFIPATIQRLLKHVRPRGLLGAERKDIGLFVRQSRTAMSRLLHSVVQQLILTSLLTGAGKVHPNDSSQRPGFWQGSTSKPLLKKNKKLQREQTPNITRRSFHFRDASMMRHSGKTKALWV